MRRRRSSTSCSCGLEDQLRELGLARSAVALDRDVLLHGTPGTLIAAVYLGFGSSLAAGLTQELEHFVVAGGFVLPVVEDLNRYATLVPAVLHPINGMEARDGDGSLEHIAARVLEDLGLQRGRRGVFLSYMRAESSVAAKQLYDALDERGFDVFLDKLGVRGGRDFQSVLWDCMADSDVVVLLDTPGALTRKWVEEELIRATAMGIGILQLVWPDHTRRTDTESCEPRYLASADFENVSTDPEARLMEDCLDAIVEQVERLRARSVAHRRRRLIDEFLAEMHEAGIPTRRTERDRVEVEHPDRGTLLVFPIVGHPTSEELQVLHESAPHPAYALYDPLGARPERIAHLAWLGTELPVDVLPIPDVGEELA